MAEERGPRPLVLTLIAGYMSYISRSEGTATTPPLSVCFIVVSEVFVAFRFAALSIRLLEIVSMGLIAGLEPTKPRRGGLRRGFAKAFCGDSRALSLPLKVTALDFSFVF